MEYKGHEIEVRRERLEDGSLGYQARALKDGQVTHQQMLSVSYTQEDAVQEVQQMIAVDEARQWRPAD